MTAPGTSRRGLLGVAGLAAASAVAGCTRRSKQPPAEAARQAYGRGEDQFGDLFLPGGTPRGTVVLLHGGFWLSDYTLELMNPVARTLAGDGWAVWNLEYRRLGSGGGWPATFEDTAAGIDHLTRLGQVGRGPVVLLGHSAGGHLAAWAASRNELTPGGPPRLVVSGVVSLAGVLDLVAGARDNLGNGTIEQLMGGSPRAVPDHYALGDPLRLVPASCPVACLYGTDDDVVPAAQSTAYVRAASQAGGDASYEVVPGTHFTLIDPKAAAWGRTRRVVAALARD